MYPPLHLTLPVAYKRLDRARLRSSQRYTISGTHQTSELAGHSRRFPHHSLCPDQGTRRQDRILHTLRVRVTIRLLPHPRRLCPPC
ncbi:hypothetical protein PISMIDRAFT_326937 [Pisolithus microcarpus 441]|uniref:Uncharacterized protein n=1 Tax=Pisolithus microcarpus 441 TaxID=765257 RepID=A0A0C9Z983_9AGAM|nr:hypothetical protein PISMIDRAFT_326937 [Pisolithus microcarpus 441]